MVEVLLGCRANVNRNCFLAVQDSRRLSASVNVLIPVR
jgi:hypothetical protein